MKILKVMFLWFLLPLSVLAQQDTLHRNYKSYFGFGLSIGKGSNDYSFGAMNLFLQRKNSYISLGTSGISAPGFLFEDEPMPFTEDVSLIIGKSLTYKKYINIQFGAGLAYVQDVSRGKLLYNTCKGMFCIFGHNVYETVKKQTIGFPIEVKTNFYLDHTATFTLGLYANLNSVNTYSGVYLGVQVGRLRDRIPKKLKILN